MQEFRFHRNQVQAFGKDHIRLVYDQSSLVDFINRPFEVSNFPKQIDEKKSNFSTTQRSVLVDELKKQYQKVSQPDPKSLENIERLADQNTFTITTGHQLSLFTGPLFFVLKILQVIKQTEVLNTQFSESKFVPVFWMASEDHDFEEIQSTTVFNEKLTWETDQSGAVGRFNLDGFEELKEKLKALFANHPESEIHELLNHYSGENLADATRNLVNQLFNGYGLVIIDGDDSALKKQFTPILKKELLEEFSASAVERTNKLLEENGLKTPVHARELNLFYLDEGSRTRIEKIGDKYQLSESKSMTEVEILAELDNHPERFSPNVVLRPVYQEFSLPNLAYIGGAGEISYWLQLKGVFDAIQLTYPIINVRNSMLWVDTASLKKMEALEFTVNDLFESVDVLKRNYIKMNAGEELDFSELNQLQQSLSSVIEKHVQAVDASMHQFAQAEIARLEKQLASIQDKLIKRSKSKNESAMMHIEQLKERLFPNGNLQERSTNFFSFSPDGNYRSRLLELYKHIDPSNADFCVIVEN